MKVLVLVSWLCLTLFLQTLQYSTCTFIPKSTNHKLILQNENKEKITNDTLVELTSRKNNEEESKDVHKVVHQRRGVYGGADLLRKGPKKNGANCMFQRPISVSFLLFFLLVAFTL
uniref:Uncharacterized protein n=1 Tax=Nicotiana tabacum TaxID=4097 RepID=A0A1S4BUE6_TOBAC|nr:uncharacterized protein LOC104113218 [Nicotiana tomentosiformis]XP_016492499.1 PREDICTED: uncharacterized protein LOC107812005 [Nicotiana tabacum]